MFLSALATLAWSTGVGSQPIADKAKIVVGDQWEFARAATPPAKADTWSQTVMNTPGDDRLTVRLGDGTSEEYDGAMNYMPQGNPDFRRALVVYPLSLGKEWPINRRFPIPSQAGTLGKEWPINRRFPNPNTSETGSAKVAAQEQITVPAGTFQCYRIDAETTVADRNYSERRFWKRWYCPDVKWIAKEIAEVRISDPRNPAASGTTIETWELIKFTPGK